MNSAAMPAPYTEMIENDLFRQTMDLVDDVVMIMDTDTRIIFVNKAYEKTYGIDRSRIIGRRLQDV